MKGKKVVTGKYFVNLRKHQYNTPQMSKYLVNTNLKNYFGSLQNESGNREALLLKVNPNLRGKNVKFMNFHELAQIIQPIKFLINVLQIIVTLTVSSA